MSSSEEKAKLNPYSPSAVVVPVSPAARQQSYGGIGRLAFVGLLVLSSVVYDIVETMILTASSELLFIVLMLLSFIATFWIVALRFNNIGYSPWWCLCLLVPAINLVVFVSALVCPAGYADHKTLDLAGKIITGFFLAMFGLAVVAAVLRG